MSLKAHCHVILEFEEVWKPPTACHVIPFDFDIVCGVVFLGSMGFKVRILQSGMVSSVVLLKHIHIENQIEFARFIGVRWVWVKWGNKIEM